MIDPVLWTTGNDIKYSFSDIKNIENSHEYITHIILILRHV